MIFSSSLVIGPYNSTKLGLKEKSRHVISCGSIWNYFISEFRLYSSLWKSGFLYLPKSRSPASRFRKYQSPPSDGRASQMEKKNSSEMRQTSCPPHYCCHARYSDLSRYLHVHPHSSVTNVHRNESLIVILLINVDDLTRDRLLFHLLPLLRRLLLSHLLSWGFSLLFSLGYAL
jgi:hypothetical protein